MAEIPYRLVHTAIREAAHKLKDAIDLDGQYALFVEVTSQSVAYHVPPRAGDTPEVAASAPQAKAPTFDPTKPVQQRNGRAAHISEVLPEDVEVMDGCKIIGRMQMTSGLWVVNTWRTDGRCFETPLDGCDLINIPARIKGWVNVYQHGGAFYPGEEIHRTKESAERIHNLGTRNRPFACIPIEFTEGEGL